MQKRYIVLRLISWIYRIVAILLVFAGMCGGVALIFIAPFPELLPSTETSSRILTQVFTGVGFSVGLWIMALGLYGAGEFIMLMVDVEENTRLAATALQRIAKL